MPYLIMATIFVILAVLCWLVGHFGSFEDYNGTRKKLTPVKWVAYFLIATLGLMTLGMSITVVGARSVGIQTSFGKYRDTLSSGLQFTAPWSSTEEFSTRVQYLDLDGENDGVSVTFKGGGGGTVNATPRWNIDPVKAGDLWKKYKTFEAVRDKLVNSTAKDSIRVVTANYTPNEARSGENLRKISAEVEADLAKTLADDGISVDSVSIKSIDLDARSQESLDKVVTANNDIERAKAEKLRAEIDAQTVKIRQESGTLSPQGLQRYCLEVVNNWNVERNGPLPAGFTCGAPVPFTVTGK